MARDLKQDIEAFWFLLTDGLCRTDFIEIRCVSVIDSRVYSLIRDFAAQNNVYCKNNCQLFINAFDTHSFAKFMELDFVLNNSKVCYGLSPRQRDSKGGLSGGYVNTNYATLIFFDIEKRVHSNTTETEKKLMLEYVYNITTFLERIKLFNFCIIDSGAGYHLVYRIPRTKITDSKKRWFKSFIDLVHVKLKSELFHFDMLKDFTRIFGLPGSMNVKRNRMVELIRFDPIINTEFKFGVKRLVKTTVSGEKHVVKGDLAQEPLVKFMMYHKHPALQNGGSLSRNNYLELPLACLLRDNGLNLSDVQDIINNININLNKKVQIDPRYVPSDYNFSKGVVNKWSMTECGVKIYD